MILVLESMEFNILAQQAQVLANTNHKKRGSSMPLTPFMIDLVYFNFCELRDAGKKINWHQNSGEIDVLYDQSSPT